MPERPLSPHLSIYRMSRYTLLSSFANRLAGLATSVGLLILTYWLVAAARGPVAYAQAGERLASPLARLTYAALLLALVYHLVAGIRHLIWDTGRGLERRQSQKSAWAIGLVTLVLVAALGYWAWRARMGGR